MNSGLGAADYELGYPLIFSDGASRSSSLVCMALASLPLDRMLLHPTAIAAWVGMLATSLNLLPGGH